MVTTYNPGAAGPRFVAGHLAAHGHDVKFIHLKELRAVAVPTTEFKHHEELRKKQLDIQYVPFQHPGEVLYVPYPSEITAREIDLFIAEIQSFNPDVVGISMFSVTVQIARRVTAWIHERLAGLPVIWGGLHCIVHPQDCLRGLDAEGGGPVNPAQVPDILCAAEGEVPMTMLMEKWDEYRNGQIPEIPGMWFVKDGKVSKFESLPFETNLDTFAFPIYASKEVLIDDNRTDHKFEDPRGWILNHIFMFTERGCPYKCSFCIHSVINKMEKNFQRIRRRSVDNVLEEAQKRVDENGMSHFIIHDEIFAIQKKWILEFAEKWRKRFKPRGITFTGYVHPLTTDFEMIEALYDAGLTRTGIGLQTGSYRTSKEVYDRPLDRDKVIRMSEWLARFPFEMVQIDLISDSPYETDDDRRETLELLLDMTPPFHVETFSLVTYEMTELMNKKKLVEEVPWKDRLFWNMLYHLTGTPFLRKETVLGLSQNQGFRENPLALEALVMDINGKFFAKNMGYIRSGDGDADDGNNGSRLTDEVEGHHAKESNAATRSSKKGPTRAGIGAASGKSWSGYRFKNVIKEKIKEMLGRQ